MEVCKKCGTEFEVRKDFVNYCSWKCRNGNELDEEAKKKISRGVKKFLDNLSDDEYENWKQNAHKNCKANGKRLSEIWKQKILDTPLHELKFNRLRKRIIFEQESECNGCGIKEWRGHFLSLELEHKDGDNQNNERENLEALCPNCHSITDTWRGRNKRNGRKLGEFKVSNKDLLNALINEKNVRQALISVGLAGKGANYKRAYSLLEMSQLKEGD